MVDGAGRGPDDADRLIANLPTVAVRAVEEVATPALPRAVDVGQLVDRTGREKDTPRGQGAAAAKLKREAFRDPDDVIVDQIAAVALYFCARRCEEVGGRHPVARQKAVHVRGRSVTRCSGVDHRDSAPRAGEHESGAETGRAPA